MYRVGWRYFAKEFPNRLGVLGPFWAAVGVGSGCAGWDYLPGGGYLRARLCVCVCCSVQGGAGSHGTIYFTTQECVVTANFGLI